MVSRSTSQKKIITAEVQKMRSFFDAEDLFRKVQKKDDKIGIATVYRQLRAMVEQGKLHSYMCKRKTVYTVDITNHCHFSCEQCGKTVHLDIKKLDFLEKVISGDICHFQIDVTGVCQGCKEEL